MSLRVVFRVAAQAEFEEAAIWYNDQRQGLGEEFLQEIDDVVSLAAAIRKDTRLWLGMFAKR